LVVFAGLASLFWGCETEKEVIREVLVEVPQWQDPPTEARGYMGYDDQEAKLTVCGNCHAGHQVGWAGTAHADAWESLETSDHSAAYCEGCHTISDRGNPGEGDLGWAATGDTRYQDVQCESCHGGGVDHISDPSAFQPLASISAGVDSLTGCGDCHSGAHHPFADEWVRSPHADIVPSVRDRVINDPDHYAGCLSCHSGQGALKAWGVRADYVEKDVALGDHSGITCAVCHDPHYNDNPAQLRFPIDEPSTETHLCMQCHNQRGIADPTSSRGPHAPEGPLLLGEAGWWPPNFEYDPGTLVLAHGTAGNPGLCTGCHVTSFTVQDTTGQFLTEATGHLFLATPCVDENGVPLEDQDCDDTMRTYDACATSGCHSSADAARNLYNVRQSSILDKVDDLYALIDVLPDSLFDSSDGVYTTAEGAKFNAELADRDGVAAHNALLIDALLDATIDQVKTDYGTP
jgi:predicted CXXCH cytochrome family protein